MTRHDSIPGARLTADLGEGPVSQPIVDWTVSRSMAGGGLPGQARAVSGSTVGTGSVSVDSPTRRTPWTQGSVRPRGRIDLDARADTGDAFAPVARMVVRSTSGSATSRTLSVSIEDDLSKLRAAQAFTTPPELISVPLDASAVIYALAAGAGYHAVPPPVESAFLAAPLVGSIAPTVPQPPGPAVTYYAGRGIYYVDIDGQAGATWAADAPTGWTYEVTPTRRPALSAPVFTTLDYACLESGAGARVSVSCHLGLSCSITVNTHGTVWLAVRSSTSVLIPGADPGVRRWQRVQIQAEWLSVDGETASGARVRARFGPTAAWSAWATHTGPITIDVERTFIASVTANAAVRGVQNHTDDDPAVWATPTARIGTSGSMLTAALPAAARSAWDTMQEIARATLGWVGIDADGALVYRGRDALRSGAPTETVISEESLEDLSWTISADDVADRVEVTYRPPTLLTTTGANYPVHTVWESTETLTLAAGRTVTITADIEGAVARISQNWLPVWNTTYGSNTWSRWNAFPNSDGTGAQPPDNALYIESTLISSNRVEIRIRNTTAAPLYVTQLTLRAYTAARAGEAITLSRGMPADQAPSTLTYDLGAWVQDDDTAREILDWLAGNTSDPLPTLPSVRVVPDPARRLGQIIKVVDRSTALAAKALISGIRMTGSAGSLTQHLDLTVLSTTFDDIDTWLTREGLDTFDKLDAHLVSLGIDTFDKLDDYLSRLGGAL